MVCDRVLEDRINQDDQFRAATKRFGGTVVDLSCLVVSALFGFKFMHYFLVSLGKPCRVNLC